LNRCSVVEATYEQVRGQPYFGWPALTELAARGPWFEEARMRRLQSQLQGVLLMLLWPKLVCCVCLIICIIDIPFHDHNLFCTFQYVHHREKHIQFFTFFQDTNIAQDDSPEFLINPAGMLIQICILIM
jgi:hypothetical protein